jgi:hypothetical protein
MSLKEKMLKINKNQKITIAIICSVAAAFLIILTGMSFYKYQLTKVGMVDLSGYNTYRYHYALI